jgi:hypothetical protein
MEGEGRAPVKGESGRWAGVPRPALVSIVLCLLLVGSIAGGDGGGSLAQENGATPAAVATPLAADFTQLVTERPAIIHDGSCAEPGEAVATLTPVSRAEGEAVGQGAAIEAERSYTIVPYAIDVLIGGQNSVSVYLSNDEPEITIACGEIGGVPSDGGSIVVKLSQRNDSGFDGIAFIAPGDPGTSGVSVFLAGERTVAETREFVAAATPELDAEPGIALEAGPSPTATAEPVQVVDIALLEWVIDLPEEVRAGQANIVVTNEGAEPHSLVIEGPGGVFELPRPIEPGQATVLNATLPAGEYVLYCPLGDGEHREKGMEATLEVAP